MAKDTTGKFGTMRPGRRQATFTHAVSPLGHDAAERNDYSPSSTVEGSRTGKGVSKPGSESARARRRNEQ